VEGSDIELRCGIAVPVAASQCLLRHRSACCGIAVPVAASQCLLRHRSACVCDSLAPNARYQGIRLMEMEVRQVRGLVGAMNSWSSQCVRLVGFKALHWRRECIAVRV